MARKTFNPENDIPDLSGKVIFITGGPQTASSKCFTYRADKIAKKGTAGIGRETIIALAKHRPEHIYFTGRDAERAAAVIDDIKTTTPAANLTFLRCDLASLSSVSQAARDFISKSQRLDTLICNAGIMFVPPGLTADGYEIQFGTNHLGHALLTKLLLPTLLRTTADQPNADVRVVSVSSTAHAAHPLGGIRFPDLKTPQDKGVFGDWTRYGQSKLANTLYAAELARRHPSITSVAVHPGIVRTSLIDNLSLRDKAMIYVGHMFKVVSPAEGAWNQLWAATAPRDEVKSGTYYMPVGAKGMLLRDTGNGELAGRLWDWTQEELKGYEA
ncbi:MAG: hypothetical protein M1813_000564 [Trichoglossum hirsutum]|nr:MAG: hypothetical protein M1813_000564 [Trichoglossum hirsutum]